MKMKFLLAAFVFINAAVFAQENDLPELKPEAGKAMVIFIRPPEMMSALDNWVLMAENEEFCRISNNRYVLYSGKPGKVTFTAKRGGIGIGKPKTGIDFDLKAGEIYYVQCQVKSNLVNVRILLNEITKRTADNFLQKAKADKCELRKTEGSD